MRSLVRAGRLALLALLISTPSVGQGQESLPVVVDVGGGEVIVVHGGRAWRMTMLVPDAPGETPPAPESPPTPAPSPDTEAFRLGRAAELVGSVRSNLARAFRATGEGTFPDVQAMVNAHADTLRKEVGDDLPITRAVRDDFERLYQAAWNAGSRTPATLVPLWLDFARGLEEAGP